MTVEQGADGRSAGGQVARRVGQAARDLLGADEVTRRRRGAAARGIVDRARRTVNRALARNGDKPR